MCRSHPRSPTQGGGETVSTFDNGFEAGSRFDAEDISKIEAAREA
jgi:hypothetical protein